MFAKEVKIKSNSLLKQSERKKLKQKLLSEWSGKIHSHDKQSDEEILSCLIPLKEAFYVKKICNHDDSVAVAYCTEKQVVTVELDNGLIPSLHTVWNIALNILTFVVPNPVIGILSKGADLMGPGILNLSQVSDFKSGQICLVRSVDVVAPQVVGVTKMSLQELRNNDNKGKVMTVLHFYGDKLFKLSQHSPLPENEDYLQLFGQENTSVLSDNGVSEEDFPELPPGFDSENVDNVSEVQTDGISEGVNNISLKGDSVADEAEARSDENAAVLSGIHDEVRETNTVDSRFSDSHDLLLYCLLCGLKRAKNSFPILVSTFQRQFFLPACPRGLTVDIKKSRFKKIMVFLKEYESQELLQLSVAEKDVWSIAGAKLDHELYRGFKVVKEEVLEEEEDTNITAADDSRYLDSFIFPDIATTYFATKAFINIFPNFSKGDLLDANQVRVLVKEYVTSQEMVKPENPNLVELTPEFAQFLLSKKEYQTHLPWQEVYKRTFATLQAGYCVKYQNNDSIVCKNGSTLPVVSVVVHTRRGNKAVTILNDLEKFGLDLKEFARALQHVGACSATVTEDAASHKKVVMLQGNHVKMLKKLFTERLKFPIKFLSFPSGK